MKRALTAAAILCGMGLAPLAAYAQQLQTFQVCRQFQELYIPGGVDAYGNHIPGQVSTRSFVVPCAAGQGSGFRSGAGSSVVLRRCSATTTTFGGLIGGGVAAAVSRPDAYGWSIPLGAVLGMGAAQAGCR